MSEFAKLCSLQKFVSLVPELEAQFLCDSFKYKYVHIETNFIKYITSKHIEIDNKRQSNLFKLFSKRNTFLSCMYDNIEESIR